MMYEIGTNLEIPQCLTVRELMLGELLTLHHLHGWTKSLQILSSTNPRWGSQICVGFSSILTVP